MTATIWKFALEKTEEQMVDMPDGAEVLSVAALSKDTYPVNVYNAKLFLWARVNPDRPVVKRRVFLVGTGKMVPTSLIKDPQFIGTVFASPEVWHVFVE